MIEHTSFPGGPSVAGQPPELAVASLVEFAAKMPSSDLFFLSNENHVSVTVRHLGMIRLLTVLTPDQGRRCISYIKVMADMDLAEQRRPMDGRWVQWFQEGQIKMVDLRVSTIPTLHGEDLAIRLLTSSAEALTVDQLGMNGRDLHEVLGMLRNPSGLILISGPTGSGKSTTLYASLQHLNDGQRKINTIEDPIEYAIPGVRQSQINLKIDVGFPELLRSILRQSPDVIMIGEIRDPITAETAVRAANSGHLVMASVHAASGIGAIQSMMGLGVHPHFLSTAIQGVIAQRIVRTLCPMCKVANEVSETTPMFDEVRAWLEPGEGNQLYTAEGCDHCYHSGYSGRSAVFEILKIGRGLRSLIADGRPGRELLQKAIAEGFLELRRAALLKAAKGITNAEELLRAIPSQELGLED